MAKGKSTAVTTYKSTWGGSGDSWKSTYKPCHESHKPFVIAQHPVSGEDLHVFGGSCSQYREGYDIYIGLCGTMNMHPDATPWGKVTAFLYSITDMQPPKDAVSFAKLIKWSAEQIMLGKKLHVGCIGGHGRTGTYLAALRHELSQDAKAIEYVRTHHCKSAVETMGQIKFLEEHYGQDISGIKASKTHSFTGGGKKSKGGSAYELDYYDEADQSYPVMAATRSVFGEDVWVKQTGVKSSVK